MAASQSLWAQPSPPAPSHAPTSAQATAAAIKDDSKDSKDSNEPSFTIENSLSVRDPFRRFTPKAGPNSDENGMIPELERYELDKYKLMGVITGPKKNKALVLSPDGRMHLLSEKQKIGLKRGIIKKIAPGMVLVEEKVVNLLGQEESTETAIEFAKPKSQGMEYRSASQQQNMPGSMPTFGNGDANGSAPSPAPSFFDSHPNPVPSPGM